MFFGSVTTRAWSLSHSGYFEASSKIGWNKCVHLASLWDDFGTNQPSNTYTISTEYTRFVKRVSADI